MRRPEKEPKNEFATLSDDEKREVLRQKGIDTEWKVIDVGGWISLFGGTFNSANIENGLLRMTSDGWEFVFFCESSRLVGGPIMVFRRKLAPRES